MQNLDRRNNYYDNNQSYIPNNYQNNQNIKNYQNSPRLYNNRRTSPYPGNAPYSDKNKNLNSPNISLVNYNQNKQNIPSNSFQNKYYKPYSQSIPNLNSTQSQKYFSPLPISKTNIENINYSNINSKPNIKPNNSSSNFTKSTLNSPLYNSKREGNKKTLILDLDETLVHSSFHPFNRKSDFTINITVEGKNHTIYVLKRPYVDEFLSEISPFFEIIIFTASISEYASPLLDELDKDKLTSGRKFRQDCLFNHGLYLKDLKSVGKNLKDVIIIDNNPVSYVLNPDNGVPILTWYEDLNDKELLSLIPLLKYLSTVEDVRPIITRIVDRQKNEINFDIVEELIKDKISENKNYKKMIYETNENYNEEDEQKNEYKENKNNNYLYQNNYRNKDKYDMRYREENMDKYEKNKYINNRVKNNYLDKKDNYNYQKEKFNNKFRNYIVDESLYKYNNNIHDSLSNM